jgi:transcriptional regulator with XRE-family HTH domain
MYNNIHLDDKEGKTMTFGEKLRELRLKHGLTQKELAERLDISYRSILNYENNKCLPKQTSLYTKIAERFNVSVEYLMGVDAFVAEASAKYGSRGKRDANELIAQVGSLFAGGELSDDDKDAVLKAIQEAYWLAKEENKKYTPLRFKQKGGKKPGAKE